MSPTPLKAAGDVDAAFDIFTMTNKPRVNEETFRQLARRCFHAGWHARASGDGAAEQHEQRIAALVGALKRSRDWLRLSDEQASPGYVKRQVELARQVIDAALAAENHQKEKP